MPVGYCELQGIEVFIVTYMFFLVVFLLIFSVVANYYLGENSKRNDNNESCNEDEARPTQFEEDTPLMIGEIFPGYHSDDD